jgi:uroporphyrinogen-III synthase
MGGPDRKARLRSLRRRPINRFMSNLDATGRRIALFRARDDAAGSAGRLRRLGFSVACAPVIGTLPLAFAPLRSRYDAVIATSAKAFLEDAPVDRCSPMFVVGAKTARAAERHGWRIVAPPAQDSAGLVGTLERTVPAGAAVLYLAGRDRKPAVESALNGRHALEIAETYAAEARKCWTSKEIQALGGCVAALHYSRRSAALAVELSERAGMGVLFKRLIHICISADAAKPIHAARASDIRVAATPDEASLIAMLIAAATVFPSHGGSRI